MYRIGLAFIVAALLAGCSSSHSDPQAAERHVCGYLMDDMTQAVRAGTVSFTSGDQPGAATSFTQGASQLRRDLATLPADDRLRVDGEQVVAQLGTISTALRSNGAIIAAAKSLDASTRQVQTLCRAVEP